MMPRKLKVGPVIYTVYFTGRDSVLYHRHLKEHETHFYGITDNLNQSIIIDGSMEPSQIFATLIHEAVHAMINVFGIEKMDEEQVVTHFSSVLADFLLNNPWIIKKTD